MTSKDYITKSYIPEDLLTVAEFLTAIAFFWVMWEVAKLCVFFWDDKSKLARLKTWEFLTDGLMALVTVGMGVALFFDHSGSVKILVLFRPLVGVANAIALRRLYNHFRRQ